MPVTLAWWWWIVGVSSDDCYFAEAELVVVIVAITLPTTILSVLPAPLAMTLATLRPPRKCYWFLVSFGFVVLRSLNRRYGQVLRSVNRRLAVPRPPSRRRVVPRSSNRRRMVAFMGHPSMLLCMPRVTAWACCCW